VCFISHFILSLAFYLIGFACQYPNIKYQRSFMFGKPSITSQQQLCPYSTASKAPCSDLWRRAIQEELFPFKRSSCRTCRICSLGNSFVGCQLVIDDITLHILESCQFRETRKSRILMLERELKIVWLCAVSFNWNWWIVI
jgi:hypothetical protein